MALPRPKELGRDPTDGMLSNSPTGPRIRGVVDSYTTRDGYDEKRLLGLAQSAIEQSETGEWSKRKSAIARSYRAFHNEHSQGSKYNHKHYSARSKLFVPKTRMAVKKHQAAACVALFSSADVISVTPANDADDSQRASAELNKELVKYRLDSPSHMGGVDWFRIAMGAVQDASIAGFCVSKQNWEYEEDLDDTYGDGTDDDELLEDDVDGGAGAGALDAPALPAPDTMATDVGLSMQGADAMGIPGTPLLSEAIAGSPTESDRRRIVRDRPIIEHHPPENAIIDLNAPYYDVVQGGKYFIMKIPLTVDDVRTMMRPGRQRMGGGPWKNLSDEVIAAAIDDDSSSGGVRTARGKGSDKMGRGNRPKLNALQLVWVHECFVKCEGTDYHFYLLGKDKFLTDPKPTREAYPALQGERPYVLGVAEIEAHSAAPTSPVESWRPLQEETNDFRNLTLDTIKQSVSPTAVALRGAKIDVKQVRESGGPDGIIYVNKMDDLRFEQRQGASPQAFAMADRIAVEFDEMASSFGQGTVQNSRALNETVGGMQLLAGSANAAQEFMLRVWVETWVEPVIRQVVKLEQYFEDDSTILGIAGQKADVYQKYGLSEDLDDLLTRNITVRVAVGIGSADPMQRLSKLQQALTIGSGLAPFFEPGTVKLKAQPILDEIFGLSGYDSSDRFIEFIDAETLAQQPPPPDPEAMKLQLQQADSEARNALENRKLDLEAQFRAADTERERDKLEIELQKVNAEMAIRGMEMRLRLNEDTRSERQVGMTERQQNRDFGMRNRELAITQKGSQEDRALARMDKENGAGTQVMAMMEQIGSAIMQLNANMQAMNGTMSRVIDLEEAPKELVYGDGDRPLGVRKGDQFLPAIYDEATGDLIGLGPPEERGQI